MKRLFFDSVLKFLMAKISKNGVYRCKIRDFRQNAKTFSLVEKNPSKLDFSLAYAYLCANLI